MTEAYKKCYDLIHGQQEAVAPYSPAWTVGEQLLELAWEEPEAAAILAEDLTVKEMSISAAAAKIRERADKLHRQQKDRGNCVAIGGREADRILRAFYGLPEAKERERGVPAEPEAVPEAVTKAGKPDPEENPIFDLDSFF